MNRNPALLACESVLVKMDAALQEANREIRSATATERQFRRLISRLLAKDQGPDVEIRALFALPHPDPAAREGLCSGNGCRGSS